VTDDDDIPHALYDAKRYLQPGVALHLPDLGVEVADREGGYLLLVDVEHNIVNIPDKDSPVGVDRQSEDLCDLCSHLYPLKVYYYK
jgi:hypothetical protein